MEVRVTTFNCRMCIAITYMCFAHGIVAVIVYETVGILFKVFG